MAPRLRTGAEATARRSDGGPPVRLEGCAVVRRGTAVVVDVTFEVGRGEIVGIVGANGSGKSTILRAAAGLLLPSRGTVEHFGAAPDRHSLRRFGAAIDAPAIYPWLTGRAALRALVGLAGEPNTGQAELALARFGLEDAGRQLVFRYSQGMKKRLALAAASLRGPVVLILDEPTNALDSQWRLKTLDWIAEEAAAGTAVLMATHNDHEIALCDRLLRLEDGALVDREPS